MTKSNKAFERYCKIESDDARMVYQRNRGQVTPIQRSQKKLTLCFHCQKKRVLWILLENIGVSDRI